MTHAFSSLAFRLGLYEAWQAPLTLAMIVVAILIVGRPDNPLARLEALVRSIALRPYVSLSLIVLLAIGGPLLLRPWLGFPDPVISDEWSLLLQAKTALLGRLANPVALPPNFAAEMTILSPAYTSQYPVLRSFPILLGYLAGVGAWGGVVLSMTALTVAVYWMAREWINSQFALVAALIVFLRFGLFSLWVNSYWMPAFTALGGTLLLGGYKSLKIRPGLAGGAALGGGVVILMTRPYEGLFFAAPIGVALVVHFFRSNAGIRKSLALPAALAAALIVGGLGLTFAQNRAATGDWKVFPYTNFRPDQQGVPPWFIARADLTRSSLRYDWNRRARQVDIDHYERRGTCSGILKAEALRFRYYWTFYVGFALSIPFVLGVWSLRREPVVLFSAGCLGLALALGSFDFAHYASPGFGFVVLSIIVGFRALRGWNAFGLSLSRTLPLALVFGLAVPLTLMLTGRTAFPMFADNPFGSACCWLWPRSLHVAVGNEVERDAGRNLVIVDSGPNAPGPEVMVANDADLDAAKTIWVNEDPEFDKATIDRYPGRRVWRVTWLDAGAPCLQLFKTLPGAAGVPGSVVSLAADPDRGWLPAPAERCPGGLTREPWTVSAKR